MKSGFDFEVNPVSSSGRLTAGQRYDVEITGVTLREKVVVWNDAIPEEARNKEFAKLSPELQKEVERAEVTYKDGKPAPRTEDRITFAFKEPESGAEFFYGVEFRFGEGGKPRKDFYAFCTAVGRPIEEGKKFKIGDVFKLGDKLSVRVVKDKAGRFNELDKESFGPAGLRSTNEATESTTELSKAAESVLGMMKEDIATLNNKDSGTVVTWITDRINNNKAGGMDWSSMMSAWKELKEKRGLIKDGKISL